MTRIFLLFILLYLSHDSNGQFHQNKDYYAQLALFKKMAKMDHGLKYIEVTLAKRCYLNGRQYDDYNMIIEKPGARVYTKFQLYNIFKDFNENVLNNDTSSISTIYFWPIDARGQLYELKDGSERDLSKDKDIINAEKKFSNRIKGNPLAKIKEILGPVANKASRSGTYLTYHVAAKYTSATLQRVWIRGYIATSAFNNNGKKIYQNVIMALLGGSKGNLKWSLNEIKRLDYSSQGVVTFTAALVFYKYYRQAI